MEENNNGMCGCRSVFWGSSYFCRSGSRDLREGTGQGHSPKRPTSGDLLPPDVPPAGSLMLRHTSHMQAITSPLTLCDTLGDIFSMLSCLGKGSPL